MIVWLRKLIGADVLAEENADLRKMLRGALNASEASTKAMQKTLDRVIAAKFDPMEIKPQEQAQNEMFPSGAMNDVLSMSDAEFLGVNQ